ncbi:MAG: ComEA family DNA-binding protein [Polyangiaceae bacterium]|nr:ComEA family DNA-binding protein [Polyangiaceae bacterium]
MRAFFAMVALALTLTLPGFSLGTTPVAKAQPGATETRTGVVNLNTATAEELVRLPGVGPSRAEAILAARQRHPFRRVQEIMRVKGIGRATFRRLEPMITVDGPTTLR